MRQVNGATDEPEDEIDDGIGAVAEFPAAILSLDSLLERILQPMHLQHDYSFSFIR